MDSDSGGRWLHYDEAASVLGITKASVRQKCIRGKLRRMHGNDGRSLVLVPDTASGTCVKRRIGRYIEQSSRYTVTNTVHSGDARYGSRRAKGAVISRGRTRDTTHRTARHRRSSGDAGGREGGKGHRSVCVAGGAARCAGGRAPEAVVAATGREHVRWWRGGGLQY